MYTVPKLQLSFRVSNRLQVTEGFEQALCHGCVCIVAVPVVQLKDVFESRCMIRAAGFTFAGPRYNRIA